MNKLLLTPALFAVTFFTKAQTVINSGITMPAIGSIDTIYTANSAVSPEPGGANATWDFHTLVTTPEGVSEVVDPATTPYFSSFPTSNFCMKLSPIGVSGSIYSYDRVSATAWEQLATNWAGPGTGDDYNLAPEAIVPLPINFNQTITDNFQAAGQAAGTVDITFDGYGTLITPFQTFTNVVRIKRDWFGANDWVYNWFSLNPFFYLASYAPTNGNFSFLKGTNSTGVKDSEANSPNVGVFPNPAADKLTIVSATTVTNVQCFNYLGQIVPLTIENNSMNIAALPNGLYSLRFTQENGKTSTAKFIKQ